MGDFTVTVEYYETRQDKMQGRSNFQGKLFTNSTSTTFLTPDELSRFKDKLHDKSEDLANLSDLCRKFDMTRFTSKISTNLSTALTELDAQTRDLQEKES